LSSTLIFHDIPPTKGQVFEGNGVCSSPDDSPVLLQFAHRGTADPRPMRTVITNVDVVGADLQAWDHLTVAQLSLYATQIT
jgi:hypothetical protein